MSDSLDKGLFWLREYVTDGVEASGKNNPAKADGRPYIIAVDDRLNILEAAQGGGAVAYATYAELAARTDLPAGTPGQVADDAGTHTDPVVGGTVPNEGEYRWSDDPAGWERIGNYTLAGLNIAIEAEEARAEAAEGTLTTNLAAEVTRATAAEGVLTTNLTTEIADRVADVNAEETRAIAAEGTLTTNLAAEITRATAAETAETAARTAADTALGVRIDKIRSFMLTVTGDADALTGTPVPAIGSAPFADGIELIIKSTFTNNQDATLLGRPMVYADATEVYPGVVIPDSYTFFLSINNTWVIQESGMDAPVTWFDRSGTWGSVPDEFIPISNNLKDFILYNNGDANMRLAFGGPDPTSTLGVVVAPGGTFTADRRLPTPIRAKADGADNPFTCYFSTTNGRNPIADAGFDLLLARNATSLAADWDTALRAFYTSIYPLLAKSRFFYFFGGPDATLARENWAANNAILATGSPARDSKTGYTFNGTSQYIDTDINLGETGDDVIAGQNDFTVGFGSTDTTPATTLGYTISAYLIQMRESNSNLLTRASAISNNSWTPSPRGGFFAMTRRNASQYDSRANSVTTTFTVTSSAPDLFDFHLAAGLDSSGVVNTYWAGPMEMAYLFKALTSSELDVLQTARADLLTAIAPL